jgi:hypothetical protein
MSAAWRSSLAQPISSICSSTDASACGSGSIPECRHRRGDGQASDRCTVRHSGGEECTNGQDMNGGCERGHEQRRHGGAASRRLDRVLLMRGIVQRRPFVESELRLPYTPEVSNTCYAAHAHEERSKHAHTFSRPHSHTQQKTTNTRVPMIFCACCACAPAPLCVRKRSSSSSSL